MSESFSSYWQFSEVTLPRFNAKVARAQSSSSNTQTRPEEYNAWTVLLGYEDVLLPAVQAAEVSVTQQVAVIEEVKVEVVNDDEELKPTISCDELEPPVICEELEPVTSCEAQIKLDVDSTGDDTWLSELAVSDGDDICQIVNNLCSRNVVEQVRYHTRVALHLLAKVQTTSEMFTRRVTLALLHFVESIPAVSSTHLLPPLVSGINRYPQHSDMIQHLVKTLSGPYKLTVLKAVVADLSELTDAHLPLVLALICPAADPMLQQDFARLLSTASDTFATSQEFGHILAASAQHFPNVMPQLCLIAQTHLSFIRKKLDKLLKGAS